LTTKKKPDLKEEIVNELEGKMQAGFEEMRKDLLADLKEEIKKTKTVQEHKPEQATPAPAGLPAGLDVGAVIKGLQDDKGGMDIGKLTGLMEATKPQIDPSNMNEQQLKMYNAERTDRLLMQIIPSLLQQNTNPMNSMFQELMMRNFMENMSSADLQRKIVERAMLKNMGMNIQDLGLDKGANAPIHVANAKLSQTPIGTNVQNG